MIIIQIQPQEVGYGGGEFTGVSRTLPHRPPCHVFYPTPFRTPAPCEANVAKNFEFFLSEKSAQNCWKCPQKATQTTKNLQNQRTMGKDQSIFAFFSKRCFYPKNSPKTGERLVFLERKFCHKCSNLENFACEPEMLQKTLIQNDKIFHPSQTHAHPPNPPPPRRAQGGRGLGPPTDHPNSATGGGGVQSDQSPLETRQGKGVPRQGAPQGETLSPPQPGFCLHLL